MENGENLFVLVQDKHDSRRKAGKKGQFGEESWTEKQFKIMTGMAHFMISTVDKMSVEKSIKK